MEGSSERKGRDEDEDDLMEWEAPYYKDTCLWLIDNAESMHRIDPDSGKSYVQRALQVACKMMEHKLVKSPSDRIGILLFNTKETFVPVEGKKMTYPGCYTASPISQVSVGPTQELMEDTKDAEEYPEGAAAFFKKKYPPDVGQIRIHYALGNAESLLNSAGKTGSRRIFFVTNVDDPYRGRTAKEKLQRNALEKIKDMRRKGIEFEAFFINPSPAEPFDTSAFYADLFQAYMDESDSLNLRSETSLGGGNDASTSTRGSWNAFDKFDDLERDAGAREMPKRVVFRLPLELADGFVIGVAGYNLVVKATKGNPVKVYREDEDDIWQEVITTSHMQCKDTGKLLDTATEVDHAFALGFDVSHRSVIRFSPEEIRQLKTGGLKPGIKILGFQDRSSLRFWENVKHSSFIFPTEAEYLGSQRAFAALSRVMLEKDKLAIGVFLARPASIPEFVALLPQAEERNGEELQTEPPGMHVIHLPFADDIREMPEAFSTTLEATDEEVAAAGRFVKAYTRNAAFNPDFYPNPGLGYHYEALKAVAFGVEIADPKDKTMPDYEAIEKRAGKLVRVWDELISKNPQMRGSPEERGGDRDSDGPTVRTSDRRRPLVFTSKEEDRLLELHSSGDLPTGKKVTVEQLRTACEHYRLAKSGNKADLIGRLSLHLDKLLAKRSRQ
ncbi:unnamed protein product [Parajaminaea phylloscopi]